jgi:predicted HD phosphohydrolase
MREREESAMETVSFVQMKDGTREEYRMLERLEQAYAAGVADRLLASLTALDDAMAGFQVSRLTHSLQTATRAEADGADEDMVVGALLHDIGDVLAPMNHAEYAATILRPYVRAEVTWVVEKHGIFQMYYYAHHLGGDRDLRDKYRAHQWYESCSRFCERWDQASFDPAYPTKGLEHFAPALRSVFSRSAHDPENVDAAAS